LRRALLTGSVFAPAIELGELKVNALEQRRRSAGLMMLAGLPSRWPMMSRSFGWAACSLAAGV
jgi:hypothetical protein